MSTILLRRRDGKASESSRQRSNPEALLKSRSPLSCIGDKFLTNSNSIAKKKKLPKWGIGKTYELGCGDAQTSRTLSCDKVLPNDYPKADCAASGELKWADINACSVISTSYNAVPFHPPELIMILGYLSSFKAGLMAPHHVPRQAVACGNPRLAQRRRTIHTVPPDVHLEEIGDKLALASRG